MTDRHVPVMESRITELLTPALAKPDSIILDCTIGLGGHAEALLTACPQVRLIGLDRDPQALAHAERRLASHADRITLVEAVYDELTVVLRRLGYRAVQGVLLDLGLSSLQIDRPERGFSYAADAPLDMRMDGKQGLTAAEVLNTYDVRDLARVFRDYGEERFADRIARRIVAAREIEPFQNSARLVSLLYDAIPMAARKTGGHPAKRTFQALRIEVNSELDALRGVLPAAIAALALEGRIAVLAYHSLEDRLVKRALYTASHDRAPRNLPVVPPDLAAELRLLTRGAERPDDEEVRHNPRAASARLRAAVRIQKLTAPEGTRATERTRA